jgi:hypothetical protein
MATELLEETSRDGNAPLDQPPASHPVRRVVTLAE